ncbi:MAG: zinc-ribbon domain-containing protein [Lachnospiraceae bacterium]|nr:zinc-ribbon domain-containing protein [Lachnospiraceae bacterium]
MWCIYCGNKLPDDAKFCFKCGKNISEAIEGSSEHIESSPNEETEPIKHEMISFSLFNRTFDLSKDIEEYASVHRELAEYVDKLCNAYQWMLIDKVHNIDDFLEIGISSMVEAINAVLKQGIKILIDNGIDSIDFETLNEIAFKYTDPTPTIEPYLKAAEEIERLSNEICEYRSIQRASRPRWYGGGFGIKGALKGALQAGVLNTGTSIIYGIENMFQDASDKRRIERAKEEAFDIGEESERIILGFYKCCIGVVNAVYDIMVQEGKRKRYTFDSEKEIRVLNNYRALYEENSDEYEDRFIDKLVACIASNPYEIDFYLEMYDILKYEDVEISHQYFSLAGVFQIKTMIERILWLRISEDFDDEIDSNAMKSEQEIEDFRNMITWYRSRFSFYNFDEYEKHLREKEALINQAQQLAEQYGKEFCSLEMVGTYISDINTAIASNDYEYFYRNLDEKNGFIEYYIERNIIHHLYASDIENRNTDKMLGIAKTMDNLSCENSNYFQYLSLEIKRRIDEVKYNTSSHISYIELNRLIRDKSKCCISALACKGFYDVESEPYDFGKELLLQAIQHYHPMAMAWLGSYYYDGRKDTPCDQAKGRYLMSIAAIARHPYGKKRMDKIVTTSDLMPITDMTLEFFESFIKYCEGKTREIKEAEKKTQEEEMTRIAEQKAAERAAEQVRIAEQEAALQARLAEQEEKKKKEQEKLNAALEQAKDEYNSLLQRQETTEKELFSSSSLLRFVKTLVIILQGSAFLAAIVGVIWMLIAKGFWWMVLSVIISFVMLVIVLSVSESIFKAVKRLVNREKANELEALNKEVEEKKKALDALEDQLL